MKRSRAYLRRLKIYWTLEDARWDYCHGKYTSMFENLHEAFELLMALEKNNGKGVQETPEDEPQQEEIDEFGEAEPARDEDGWIIS